MESSSTIRFDIGFFILDQAYIFDSIVLFIQYEIELHHHHIV